VGRQFETSPLQHLREQVVVPADESKASTNTAESFFSLLKRAIIGAWYHISREHLPRYANEFTFRWNTRRDTDGQRLQLFIKWIAGKRLTCRQVSQPLCVC
jgi:hypothetical protein